MGENTGKEILNECQALQKITKSKFCILLAINPFFIINFIEQMEKFSGPLSSYSFGMKVFYKSLRKSEENKIKTFQKLVHDSMCC